MSHLTEYTSVGGGDTLDSVHGVIGIEVDIGSGVSVKVNVLSCYLSVSRKLTNKAFGCDEAALTVRYRNVIYVTYVGVCKPGRLIGSNTGGNNSALVSAYGVEGKGRTALVGIDDLSVRNETELDT